MLSPEQILTWLEENVKEMRRSRAKTLADIVPAAMAMCGIGVLALGRAMNTATTGKHNIKRVNRLLGNTALEVEALAQGIFDTFALAVERVLVLADWTDVANGKLLVFSLPANGRSIPFFVKVIAKDAREGAMIKAENEALEALERICRHHPHVVIVADRGFGNKRWITRVQHHGFHFVQRVNSVFFAETEHYIGKLHDMDVRKGARIRDWGRGTIGEDECIRGRLITAFDPEAKEPWYLVTDLEDIKPEEAVSIYRRRWWIETMFRDKKNRDWGLGLDQVKLKDYRRYERLSYIVALAFTFLVAHGALAEEEGFDKGCKANTRKVRVLNLLRLGHLYLRKCSASLERAVQALRELARLQTAPNWG